MSVQLMLKEAGNFAPMRTLTWILAGMMGVFILSLVATPWQQSVTGSGRVIAYAPLERQQAIEAPIAGRVTHWYVQEGDRVEKGQPVADIADNDPNILRRLEQEAQANRTQVDAGGLSLTLTEDRIASLRLARDSAVANARLRIQMARDRKDAAQRAVDAAQASLKTAELNLVRQQNLHADDLTSKRDLELAELDKERAHTDLDRAKAAVSAAAAEVGALQADRDRVSSSHQANVESTQATLEKLKGDRAKAEAELMKVEVRLARQQQMQVVAPRSGTIMRLVAKQGTEMVSSGEPLVILVPETDSRAVEIYVDGNDAPLVDPGRHVRLQFEGWPAVQFVGWPSAAVGTFGGRVSFVDAHDDGKGRFRVVVVPEAGEEWPEDRYLRQGVRANGWILLNQVRLGFELWRQFNGFPPVLEQEEKT